MESSVWPVVVEVLRRYGDEEEEEEVDIGEWAGRVRGVVMVLAVEPLWGSWGAVEG